MNLYFTETLTSFIYKTKTMTISKIVIDEYDIQEQCINIFVLILICLIT